MQSDLTQQLIDEAASDYKMSLTPDVSFLIPVANEGSELKETILNFSSAVKSLMNSSMELILGTDNTHVPTWDAMKFLQNSIGCKVYFLTARIGKGGTLKNILRFASGKVVALLDADVPVPVHQVVKAVESVIRGDASVVVCTRKGRKYGVLRKFLSVSYNTLVKLLFRTGIIDHQAGFKVLRSSCAFPLILSCRTDGLAFDTELIVNARRRGLTVKTFNVDWKDHRTQSSSNVVPFRVLLTMLADLLIFRLLLWSNLLQLKLLPVGLIVDEKRRVVGTEYMSTVSSKHPKALSILRKLYLTVAFLR